MAFELHRIRRPKDFPAAITLRERKDYVTCFLSVSMELVKTVGGSEKTTFDVLLGSAEDTGKMQLRVNKGGAIRCRRVRKGDWLTFDLGPVNTFPQEEIIKQRCDAKRLDETTIEIMLPMIPQTNEKTTLSLETGN